MNNASIVDVLIGNIKEDQMLLNVLEAKIEESKSEKRVIVDRLKAYRKDSSVLLKYADDKQKAKIEELGFALDESERGLNPVASRALDIIMKAKGNALTNGELYETYVKSLKNKDEAVNYTEFNIKSRSLFNTQRLLRKKGKDDTSSRDNIISINGSVITKEEKNESK